MTLLSGLCFYIFCLLFLSFFQGFIGVYPYDRGYKGESSRLIKINMYLEYKKELCSVEGMIFQIVLTIH